MVTRVLVETASSEECSAAASVLRHMGYGVRRVGVDANRLAVRVAPGERPQAALRTAGIEFRLRQMWTEAGVGRLVER
jgi:hypothetical protein